MPCCDQSFWVQDESGVGLTNALVVARKSVQTGFWEVTSDTSNGSAILTLDEGDTYTATVTKSGYTCVSCTKTFKPCIGRITFTLKESDMAAKACINWIEPEKSTSVRVGDTVNCRIAMYNCGDADGNFYVAIDDDVCADYNFWLERYVERICSGSFVMPNRIVTLKFRGGHSEGSNWIPDFSKSITLTPHGYCDQKFRVVDEDGVNIDNATVSVDGYGHCTTYYGYCTVSDLEVGWSYIAIASKAGYDCLNCSKTFTACTSTITLTLKKKITTCNQSFIVKDTSGNTVTKNCIIVVREGGAWKNECATSSSGTCTVGLIKGTSLRACVEQVPSGYEAITDSCKNFTACTSRITLKLKKIVTTGTLRVTSTPVQGADIYINDILQSYKTNHDFTLEAGYYDVKAILAGYKEPAMQGATIVAGQTKTLTFTLVPYSCNEYDNQSECEYAGCYWYNRSCHDEPQQPSCSEYTDESSCIAANCFWYDGACHDYVPVECSDYTDALTCTSNNCYWWSDNTCHSILEGIPNCGDYDNTSKEECELQPGCYWWDLDNTCRNTQQTNPEYDDTEVLWNTWEVESIIDEEVTFAVRLVKKGFLDLGLNDKPVNFYVNDVLLNEEPIITTDSPGIIGLDGYAEIKYAFSESGVHKIKAVFPGDEGYNSSKSVVKEITVAATEGPLVDIIDSSLPISIKAGTYGTWNWDYHLKGRISNIGSERGDFQVILFIDGHLEGKAYFTYNGISPGDSDEFKIDISSDITEETEIKLEAWEQYKYEHSGEPDDTAIIPVKGVEKEPSLWNNLVRSIADMLGVSDGVAQVAIIASAGVLLILLLKK